MNRLHRMFLSFWVDNKRQQQPQFNYGRGLGRDLCNAGVHTGDRNIWHTITQQKNVYCNKNGGGYIWVNPEQLAEAAAENILQSPISYAEVLPGLLPLPDEPAAAVPAIPSPAKSNLTTPLLPQLTIITPSSPSPSSSQCIVPNHAPQRHSRR